jgi:hypothetical protein
MLAADEDIGRVIDALLLFFLACQEAATLARLGQDGIELDFTPTPTKSRLTSKWRHFGHVFWHRDVQPRFWRRDGQSVCWPV